MSLWDVRRSEPYTERGVSRGLCARGCGRPGVFQWTICADGNNYRRLCAICDVALNRAVLEFMRHPRAEELMERYRERVLDSQNGSPETPSP